MTAPATRVSSPLRAELPQLLKLAGPVILAELGWMAMGVVDTIMVGRLGAEAIGAVAVGNIVFNCIGILLVGFLLGMDTLISQAFGAGDIEDCRHSLRQGLWLGWMVAPVLIALMLLAVPLMSYWGLDPGVLRRARPFTSILIWSLVPLVFYFAFRRYLQSTNVVRPVAFALVTANLVNWIGNILLIPKFGVEGSALATIFARCYMAGALAFFIPRAAWRWEGPDWKRIRDLFRLGLPAAGHIFLEIGVFGAATALAGRFPAYALAAHEVALNNASVTFMIPLGVSSAAAVRVGQAIGRGDSHGARTAGWTAIAVGAIFMAGAGLAMLAFPRAILGIYTTDSQVIEFGVPLLYAAAAFQLFDGIQVVSIGALRGVGDTTMPFIANTVGYWILGLPVGAWLCFGSGWGVLGLWVGLSLGLMTVALVLLLAWALKWKEPRRSVAPMD